MAPLPPPTTPPVTSPPGWYPDPWGVAPLRYWDGSAWTGHTADQPAEAATLPLTAGLRGLALLAGLYLLAVPLVVAAATALDLPDAALVALTAAGLYLPMLWWCRQASHRYGTGSLRRDLGLTWRAVDLAWAVAALLGAWVVQGLLVGALTALGVPIGSNTEGIADLRDDTVVFVLLGVAAVVVAPVVEELFFRGLLLRSLRSRLAVVPALVAQAALFALFHLDPTLGWGNVGLVLVLTGVGLVLGVVTWRVSRLGPAVLAHALYNGAAFLVLALDLAPR